MFENTLLIIKSDCMFKRKSLLLHLLSKDFFIQGNRKLAFTPEDAAEFYKDMADDKCYMLYVILLSKGTSEAFIITGDNAVEQLLNTLICHFGTSVEMERNVHISRSVNAARREITFIFPNYIHEPILAFDSHEFCNQPLMAPFLGEVYNIVQATNTDSQDNWRTKLSNWLIMSNNGLPQVSNQCSLRPQIGFQEKYQQTEPIKPEDISQPVPDTAHSILSSSSRETSGLITSTSCITCSSFEREAKPCEVPPPDIAEFEARLKIRACKTLKEPVNVEETKLVCDEFVEWVDVFEYEGDDDSSIELERQCEDEVEVEDAEKIEAVEGVSYFSTDVRAQEMEGPTDQTGWTDEINEMEVEEMPQEQQEVLQEAEVEDLPPADAVQSEKTADEEIAEKISEAVMSAEGPAVEAEVVEQTEPNEQTDQADHADENVVPAEAEQGDATEVVEENAAVVPGDGQVADDEH